jgi:Uma2 family endonuclease
MVLPRKMTIEEWASMDEDEAGELVDGMLVEEEMGDWIHESVVAWLIMCLGMWLRERGFVAGSDLKYALRAGRGRKPDVSVFLLPRVPPRRGVVRMPPDIAIEVVSPTARDRRRDRVEKMSEYATFGVRWYWIVDPEKRTFEVFTLEMSGKNTLACSADAGKVEAPGLEGLVLDLDALWRKIDSLGPAEDE